MNYIKILFFFMCVCRGLSAQNFAFPGDTLFDNLLFIERDSFKYNSLFILSWDNLCESFTLFKPNLLSYNGYPQEDFYHLKYFPPKYEKAVNYRYSPNNEFAGLHVTEFLFNNVQESKIFLKTLQGVNSTNRVISKLSNKVTLAFRIREHVTIITFEFLMTDHFTIPMKLGENEFRISKATTAEGVEIVKKSVTWRKIKEYLGELELIE